MVLILLATTVVALSWALVHTVYALRTAISTTRRPTGGIDFNDSGEPDYRDFAYLALTIGATATRHAPLAFLFGSVIVALLINTAASLLRWSAASPPRKFPFVEGHSRA